MHSSSYRFILTDLRHSLLNNSVFFPPKKQLHVHLFFGHKFRLLHFFLLKLFKIDLKHYAIG